MPTLKRSIVIDATDSNSEELVTALCWRVDPIRKELRDEEEEITNIVITNVESTRLPPLIKERIDEIRKFSRDEAELAIRDFIRASIMLWIPAEIHREIRRVLEIMIGAGGGTSFTKESIPDLIKEYRRNRKDIMKKSDKRVIENAIKEVFEMSVAPELTEVNFGLRSVSARMDNRFDRIDSTLKGIAKSLAAK